MPRSRPTHVHGPACKHPASDSVHAKLGGGPRRAIHQCGGWGSGGDVAAEIINAAGDSAAAVLFERALSKDIHAEAQRFADAAEVSTHKPLAERSVSLPQPKKALARMARSLVTNALPPGPMAEIIARDAVGMVKALDLLVGKLPGATLTVALEVVAENRCQRWHVDWYAGRFTATYGNLPGTVFIDGDAVDFKALVRPGASNELIVPNPDRAVTARPGTLALIKGEQWPSAGGAIVHRSPEVAVGSDGMLPHRLLIKVDVRLEEISEIEPVPRPLGAGAGKPAPTSAGFWGLVVEPGREHARTCDEDVDAVLTMVSLGLPPSGSIAEDGSPAVVHFGVNDKDHVIAILRPGKVFQQRVNLPLPRGEKISLWLEGGKLPVHLTGFVNLELLTTSEPENDSEDDATDDVVEDEKMKPAQKKRKADGPVKPMNETQPQEQKSTTKKKKKKKKKAQDSGK